MSATYDAPAGLKSAWPERQDGADYNAHGFGADETRTHCGRRMSGNWIFADVADRPVDCARCLSAIERSAREPIDRPLEPTEDDIAAEYKSTLKSATSRQLYALRYLKTHADDASARRRFDIATRECEDAFAAFYGACLTAAGAVLETADRVQVAA